jgi:hypothetical protein
MRWYVAELIVICRVGKSPKPKVLYDRQIKVLCASDHEAAYQRVLQLGKEENHSYRNSAGERIYWRFAGIGNLEVLQDEQISDGTEIHSRLERGNPKSEIRRKRDLTVFWAERNKHKTAAELLNPVTKPFAPR